MSQVVSIKDAKRAPTAERSSMETLLITPDQVNAWTLPPFQRPLRVNDRVMAIAEELKLPGGGVINGVLTLGLLGHNKGHYWLVDGQHRVKAFIISEIPEAIVDVRIVHFDTMAEMAEEFVRLNSRIVNMRPDDLLRGLEPSMKWLKFIRESCEYVGYGAIRRGTTSSTLVSMSAVIKQWAGSRAEAPVGSGGVSATQTAESLDQLEAETLVAFLQVARSAWGADQEYARLWSGLNMVMCMWLYRRLVVDRDRTGTKRYVLLTKEQFRKCLMSLSASSDYIDWLSGRVIRELDRSPCYQRVKTLFGKRLQEEKSLGTIRLPQPSWAGRG